MKGFDKLNEPVRMKKPFVVRQLFPKLNGYMTYAGSLTTPSCAEAVTWIVLSETFPVTLEQVSCFVLSDVIFLKFFVVLCWIQVDNFKEIQYEEKRTLKNNYRNLQQANNRPVIVVLPEEKSVSDAASPLQLSLGTLFFMLIAAKLL